MMRSSFLFLALGLLAFSTEPTSGATVELTKENYDELTAGKTVFIKFLAPWYVLLLGVGASAVLPPVDYPLPTSLLEYCTSLSHVSLF